MRTIKCDRCGKEVTFIYYNEPTICHEFNSFGEPSKFDLCKKCHEQYVKARTKVLKKFDKDFFKGTPIKEEEDDEWI